MELGSTLCGLAAGLIREIVPLQPFTRLPGAPAWVRGMVNLRGQIVTVMDLKHRLRGEPAAGPDPSIVVVQADERTLGMVVDDVREVTFLSVMPTEEAALGEHAGLVVGLGRLEDEVVLVIDVPELVRQTLA